MGIGVCVWCVWVCMCGVWVCGCVCVVCGWVSVGGYGCLCVHTCVYGGVVVCYTVPVEVGVSK